MICLCTTVWKFQDFTATQILREINFGRKAQNKCQFLTLAALNF